MSANYTPTQKRILAVLADGLPHSSEELLKCIGDDLSPSGNLRVHLSLLRKKLRPLGEDILCEYSYRTYSYRHVKLLCPASRA